MAWTITQHYPRSDHEGWWMLKEALVAGGATVKLSSDGITDTPFNYDQISPGGPYVTSGAGSFVTTGAWMVFAFPTVDGVTREICLEKHNFAGRIHCWYSSDGTGFTGGAKLARATAVDEEFLQDGADNFFNNGNPQQQETTIWVGDVNEKYSFLCETRNFGITAVSGSFFMDVVVDPNPGDADPCVVAMAPDSANSAYQIGPSGSNTLFGRFGVNGTGVNIAGWYDKGGALENWVAWPWTVPGFAAGSGGSVDAWHWDTTEVMQQNDDGNYEMMPVVYMRGEQLFALNEKGWKGISRIFQVISSQATGFTSGSRAGQRANADGTLVAHGGIVRPWDPALPKVWT